MVVTHQFIHIFKMCIKKSPKKGKGHVGVFINYDDVCTNYDDVCTNYVDVSTNVDVV